MCAEDEKATVCVVDEKAVVWGADEMLRCGLCECLSLLGKPQLQKCFGSAQLAAHHSVL